MNRSQAAWSDLAFFGLLLALLVLSAGGHVVVGDEETMFRVTQNLMAGKGLTVSREILTVPAQSYAVFLPTRPEMMPTTSVAPGRDGGTYAKSGIGPSLVVIPLYTLGALLAQTTGVNSARDVARQAVAMLNPLALAGCGWLMVRFGRALGYRISTGRWVALASLFTSMAWPYVKTFYPQPSVAFLVLAAVYAAYRWRRTPEQRWLWTLATAFGIAILFRITVVIILPALALYLFWAVPVHRNWRWMLPLGAGVAVALALTATYNWLRFGSMLSTGYDEIAWTTPVLLGLYGLLFSPGKSVMVYAPMLTLSLGAWVVFARAHRAEAWLLAGLWLSYLVFYAPYNFWTGGFNWGPRFLLPVLPLGFLPIGALLEERKGRLVYILFGLLFLIGLVVQTPAILVDHSRYLYQHLEMGGRAYDETIYQPAHSPVVRQWPVALELLHAYAQAETGQAASRSLQEMAESEAVSTVPNGRALLQAEFLRRNTPDFWWLNGRLLDSSRPAPLAAVSPWLLLGLISALILWLTRRGQTRFGGPSR